MGAKEVVMNGIPGFFSSDGQYCLLEKAVSSGRMPLLVNGICEAARPAFA